MKNVSQMSRFQMLKQLERITDERLLGAVQMMRREKKSGYQEGIL